MINRKSLNVLMLLAAMLLAGTASAMVREVSFRELTRLSETTMEVVVVNSYAEWNAEHTAIFTHYVVEPLRQVGGGERGARFELLFAGGRTTDGKQMIVTEVPTLEVGGQYILFLHPRETRHAAPTVGLWQGALRVVREPGSNKAVLVDPNGQMLEKDSSGEIRRGRHVEVDRHGFMSPAPAAEREPGMEQDPVLKDGEGKIIPLRDPSSRPSIVGSNAAVTREPVDADTLMNMVESFRRQQARGNQ